MFYCCWQVGDVPISGNKRHLVVLQLVNAFVELKDNELRHALSLYFNHYFRKKKRKRVSYCVPVFVISSVPRFFYHFFVACIEPLLSRVCDLNAVLVIFDSNV